MYITLRNLISISKIKIIQFFIYIKIILRCLTFYFNSEYWLLHYRYLILLLFLPFSINIFQILHQDLNTFLYIILITLDPFCRLFFKIILYQNLNTFLYIITIFLLKYIKAFCILLQYFLKLDQDLNTFLYIITIFLLKYIKAFCILLQCFKN